MHPRPSAAVPIGGVVSGVRVAQRRRSAAMLLSLALCGACQPRPPQPTRLSVKVILAHRRDAVVDGRVRPWAQALGALPYTGFSLRDEATFTLDLGSSGHLQLPDRSWLTVTPLSHAARHLRARVELSGAAVQSTVVLGQGATLAIGGVAHEGGRLLVTVTLVRA